ncbi:MAG TPA: STAS domain-containing protein [Xanthomonadales bacterium]|nr:STAS domain-containing protein [Xanthomonadales bacterium]
MEPTPLHFPLRLHAGDGAARSKIAAAVDALLERDLASPRLSVVLDGERLPADVVAALIAGLRRVREHGGAIEIVPGSDAVRDALALAGLNRVFAFPLVPAEHAHRTGLLARLAAASFAAALAFVGVPAFAGADRLTDPAAILARVEERNPSLTSYQGRMHVDLRMTSFPFIRQHLDGTTYYKRPSNYEVVFDKVPPLAKGFDKMFADVGDPANWEKRFVVTYQGEREYQGRKDIELKLVQRVRGMIDHETVLVDPNAWAIDSIRYDYYNGGHITMTQTFRQVGGYSMLAEQNAEIAIPYAKAVAHGTYSDYKTNVAVDDAVFTKKN